MLFKWGFCKKTHQACIKVYHFRKISNSLYLNWIIKTHSTVMGSLYTQIPSRYLRQLNIETFWLTFYKSVSI